MLSDVCICNRISDHDQGYCTQALFYLATVEEYAPHPQTLSYFAPNPELFRLSLVQAAHAKQAARHSEEVEELLLELSKQHAAAQATLPQQGTSEVVMKESTQLKQEQEEDELSGTLTPSAPRLTTPVSPSRRPSTHPKRFHIPPEGLPDQGPIPLGASLAGGHAQRDESLRAERGRSFTSSFNMSKQYLAGCL